MRYVALLAALALGGCTLSGLGAKARIGKDSTVVPERAKVERAQPERLAQGDAARLRADPPPGTIWCPCPAPTDTTAELKMLDSYLAELDDDNMIVEWDHSP